MNLHDPSQNDCGTHAPPVSRREFLGHVAAGAMAVPLLGSALAGCAHHAASSGRAAASSRVQSGHNIIFTDQERYFRRWPAGLALPARERLRQTGVTFHNHYCPATMCTSSRSVLLTGLQTADTGMFENTDLPWIKNLSPPFPPSDTCCARRVTTPPTRGNGISTAISTGRRTASSSAKLEALIKREIGVDNDREMPEFKGLNWILDVKDDETILD